MILFFLSPLSGGYGRLDLSYKCAYPYTAQTTFGECPELDQWSILYRAKKLTLVYASAFPDNPASVLGHTFLRIDSEGEHELLHYALNFEAQTTESSGPLFMAKGLFGGYEGRLKISPYFMKVNEYTKMERRDLWEYELNFTQEEIRRLLLYVWEVENTQSITYYFLSQNCSSYIIHLLEVGRPSLKLKQELPFYVVPSETVKVIQKAHLITKTTFRPSLKYRYDFFYKKLTSPQKEQLESIIDQKQLPPYNLGALEMAILHFDHLRYSKQRSWTEKESKWVNTLLAQRSQYPATKENENLNHFTYSPDQAHNSKAITFWGGYKKKQEMVLRLAFRPLLHELMDPDIGYVPFSEIKILNIEGEYLIKSSRFLFSRGDIVSLMAFNPLTFSHLFPSWKMNLTLLPKGEVLFRGAGGLSVSLRQDERDRAYLLFPLFLSSQKKPSLGIEAGYLLSLGERAKIHFKTLFHHSHLTHEEEVSYFLSQQITLLGQYSDGKDIFAGVRFFL